MRNYKKIIAIKVGWCETYQGDKPIGNHAYLKKSRNIGHETFNFKKFKNTYYGYIPPKAAIEKNDEDGWLVLSFALHNGTGKLCLVGWHENATITSEYIDRPEYRSNEKFPKDANNRKFFYHYTARRGFCIPANKRDFFPNVILGERKLGSAKVVYLRGHNQTQKAIAGNKAENKWREILAKKSIEYISNYSDHDNDEVVITGSNSIVCPDEKKKKAVESIAIDMAEKYLKKEGFGLINNREKERGIGYDLQAINRNKEKYYELHVEVKGTSLCNERFFLSRNEYNAAESDKHWRLIVVSNALEKRPKINFYTWKEARKKFNIESLSWYAEEK
ncbi:MAG: DUF3883 domain-containing protein [Gammaproteobacteria bacterium]|nr:DUF3883 domain-containing protein [Gammaproteobacteria bacterium]